MQESAELLRWRRCGDRAAPSPRAVLMGAGRFLWSIDPRADIKRLCKAQFVVRYTLSSIVIRCFNHCLQTTPNNVLRVLLSFRWTEQFIALEHFVVDTNARVLVQPMLAAR